MEIKHFFDQETFTLTYLVTDPETKDSVIIDPVLDFDQASGKIEDKSAIKLIDYIKEKSLNIRAILETHAHADHLSSSQLLKKIYPKALVAIGEKITIVQDIFKTHFNIDYIKTNGSQFDLLLEDNKEYKFGSLAMKAIPTPGHTPACMSYLFDEHLFSGDALFMPDFGTGRCDFPKGSAEALYNSVFNNLYSLPDETKVYVGHDYSPGGREMLYQTTIKESKINNIQLKSSTSKLEFIEFRTARDQTLKTPKLLLPSIQINIDAGNLPPLEDNKTSYLKLPLKLDLKVGKL